MQIKYDDIKPPGVYIKLKDCAREKFTEHIFASKGTIYINRDKDGDVCSIMVVIADEDK